MLQTGQYHLRCLLVRWMDFDALIVRRSEVLREYFDTESAGWHVGILMAITIPYLVIAGILLRYREFTAASETDT